MTTVTDPWALACYPQPMTNPNRTILDTTLREVLFDLSPDLVDLLDIQLTRPKETWEPEPFYLDPDAGPNVVSLCQYRQIRNGNWAGL